MLTEYLGSAVDCTIKREGCIPKIIHHIWLGSPFPDHLVALRQTWQRHHDSTEWQMQLWDDDAIASFGLMNYEAYNAATNFGEKSDIARYEILYRLGGVYVDTDFECISALDDLHELTSSRAAPSLRAERPALPRSPPRQSRRPRLWRGVSRSGWGCRCRTPLAAATLEGA